MNKKRYIIMGAFILIFLVVIVVSIFKVININSKKISIDFSDFINNENSDDISLTVIYESPYTLTTIPLSIDHFIDSKTDEKIVIKGNDLVELFRKIKTIDLIPVKKRSSHEDVRLYYVLESKKNGKLIDVAMWGYNNSIYVNRIEVKGNTVFYDIVRPLLPEDIKKDFDDFLE